MKDLHGCKVAACFSNLIVGAFIEATSRLAVIRTCMHVIQRPSDEKPFTEMLQVAKE